MKMIGLVAIVATLIGVATNRSSVGGPMTELLIDLLAMGAIGVQQAYVNDRGALGWVASLGLSFVGGVAALAIGSTMMEWLLSAISFQGSLARSNHPLLYILSAGMTILTVLGSWSAVQTIRFSHSFRSRRIC